jgi:hypothetical protein
MGNIDMHKTTWINGIVIIATMLLNTGCATSVLVSEGTIMLREVTHVLTRQEIVTGDIEATKDNRGREPIKLPDLHERLLKSGIKDSDIVDGSIVLGRTQFYWHNVASGIVRQGSLLSTVEKGLVVEVGNIVEVERRGDLSTVTRVKYKNLMEGGCDYRTKDKTVVSSFLNAINPIGGPGAASLYCPYLAEEGWTPIDHGYGVDWTRQLPVKQ